MTGGRSPSSPWVQSAQGCSRDRTAPFHPTLSPSNTGLQSSGERSSPNYFGIAVENSNPSTSSPGLHTQKNWGSLPRAHSALPSPKLHLYSQESVSEGLVNLLRTESKVDKGRRESAFQGRPSNGDGHTASMESYHAHPHGQNCEATSRVQEHSNGRGPTMTKTTATSPQNSLSGSSQWISDEQCAHLLQSSSQDILLLDVRPYAHFSQANINGSLNLCIPTTLLKRRSFDTQKLAATFTSDADKKNFGRWKECKTIIVYDAATTDVKDAVPLLNVINKFQAEDWNGQGLVLQNGFKGFSDRFPRLIHRPQLRTEVSPKKRSPMSLDIHSIAPVVGGCALPDSSSAANPFFGNIRQNMDLMGGVGQIPLKVPDHLSEAKRQGLPPWLREAADIKDQGRIVSERKFSFGRQRLKKYRVAGIEKGTKNRYNDIYPFDHTRVRLEGIPSGACDYVNANHIQAELSNRRYIATQAPVPDTFNDFWRVVWEQDVRLIVSLTAELERGQVKCHPFWRSGDYGPFLVKTYSERFIHVESKGRSTDPTAKSPLPSDAPPQSTDSSNENPVIIVRHFSLYHTSFPFQPLRDITQLQYPYWPDFGTTSQPTHLLNLIEQCNKVIRSTSTRSFGSQHPEPSGQRPVLVHCSAGCGRTGTFCTVDSVLDILKSQRSQNSGANESSELTCDTSLDLITKTVEDFRTQRPSMVQNLSQFVLCYESVLEWLVSQTDKSG
ncbi:uncharacterized protein N7443_005572 [Penicillium atrosanguineum]|uniref:protein-tyrosine-phosphatase n=1 Tax=Penicillium atrosanguineum TaxID=1132637 RepID=A0A9W9U2K3_9EURO|nr:uncharacterized protein N7443_005572 [Penicillium atrosanguineum]KAJ5300570.1 hypothetical protein N7443_005572 [Penicillium atrosanguineum]KAJ5311212.1 hypothetical protein N7476_007072 [Penicillium atrosanguineum]